MLQLQNIRKAYTTGDFTQVALDDVSISFRENEFVAILGPSGSGKTTLLNIVGGLDQYDDGNLIIAGVETSRYRDRDWDTYRNDRVGFVFQSYNLIPHQSILANVELALTLSGVSRAERRARALAALDEVGLAEHVHKRPSQLSGGQMQRVAIARALINDPTIVLADEPTGALDSETSEQIMDLLTNIARDRLVVMVTHNPELAEQYATRTVNLKDGHVVDDTDPYLVGDGDQEGHTAKRTSMSFFTAISLSFNNLMTKKGRTLMTAFAGSIGIIGIAAILALANGVNNYIKQVEEDTLSAYPLTIQSQGMDMTTLMGVSAEVAETTSDTQAGDIHEIRMMSRMFESIGSNDLAALKVFLDDDGGGIDQHVSSIHYSYNVTPQIFSAEGTRQVNPDTSLAPIGFGGTDMPDNFLTQAMSPNLFSELMDNTSVVENQYQVLAGRWPTEYNELVVVLTPTGGISDFMAYAMNLRNPEELTKMVQQMADDQPITTPTDSRSYSFEEILDVQFKLIEAANYYQYDPQYGVWTDKSGDREFMKTLASNGEDLHVVGVVQSAEGAAAAALQPGIYYPPSLTSHLIDSAARTQIVRQQLDRPNTNVFTGRTFVDEEKNPQREDFDIASLITIDEEAIQNAFTFDESKLTIDTSSLNNISLPEMQFNQAGLPELELGDLMSELDLTGIGAEIDLQQILTNMDLGELEGSLQIDPEEITTISSEAVQEYLKFAIENGLDPTDTETNFPLFLESPKGQELTAQIEKIGEGLEELQTKVTEQLTEAITKVIQEQISAQTAQMSTQLETALTQYMQQAMAALSGQISAQIGPALEAQIGGALEESMSALAANMSDAMGIDEEAFANAFQFDMDEAELTELLISMMGSGTSSYDGNLDKLGYADYARPSAIDIYPVDFEGKGQVIQILDDYNAQMVEDGNDHKVITYTDFVGALMSSVTDIVNVISYVLVAFVAISLVVSSIMIGVITYISVLERKKEIGILRSIGASKKDIRRVFNAETLIVGLVAGLLGISITVLLTIPANIIVASKFAIHQVAVLPVGAGIALVLISMGLTFLAGLIPSSAASRKDPVEALRSE